MAGAEKTCSVPQIGQCPAPTDEIKRTRGESLRSSKPCFLGRFEFGGVLRPYTYQELSSYGTGL